MRGSKGVVPVVGGLACPAGIGRLKDGPPPIQLPNIAEILGPVKAGLPTGLVSHSNHYPAAHIMQWNLTVQKQIGENVVTMSYVGMLGRHLQWAQTVNTPVPTGSAVQPSFIRSATIPNVQGITLHTTGAGSAYNAAQFVFERRYSKGLTVNATYTSPLKLSAVLNLTGTLIAKRAGDGSGRTYSQTVTVTDQAGNTNATPCTWTVTVPHDQRGRN